MKRYRFVCVLAAVLLWATSLPVATSASSDMSAALQIYAHAAGVLETTPYQAAVGDLDFDGALTMQDALVGYAAASGMKTALPTALGFTSHGVELPVDAFAEAPSAILTTHEEWYAFATQFDGVDAACFQVRGSFTDRALLAVPLCCNGYAVSVATDDETVYVSCMLLGEADGVQRYLLIEADPAAVAGKSLQVQTFKDSGTAVAGATVGAVRSRGNYEYDGQRVFTSRDELKALATDCYQQVLDDVTALSAFDGRFFEEYVLVYTAMFTPSGGYEMELASDYIVHEGAIVIRHTKTVPSYGDMTSAVVGCHAFLTPVSRTHYTGQPITVMDKTTTWSMCGEETVTVAPAFETLYNGGAFYAYPTESYAEIVRSYDEWQAMLLKDVLYHNGNATYADAADEAFFEERALLVFWQYCASSPPPATVTAVRRNGTALTVELTQEAGMASLPALYQERLIVSVPAAFVEGAETVTREYVVS